MAILRDRDAGFRGLKLVHEGEAANVLAEAQIFLVLQSLAAKDEERWGMLVAVMERYCSGQNLNGKQWNSEGRHGDGSHGEVMLYAMKCWQFRLYGFQRNVKGKKSFVAVDLDPSKKTDKANQKLLKRAAKNCGPFVK